METASSTEKMGRRGGARGIERVLFLASFLALPVLARGQAYVKSVEYVEVSLGSGQTQNSANLSKGQTNANCVPFASMMATGTGQNFDQSMTDVYFEAGPTRVTARREVAGGTVDIGVYVVEFDPTFVRVQQNTFTFSGTSTTAAITGVNLSKAALLSYYRGSFTGNKWWGHAIAGSFSATNQLTFERNTADLTATGHYYVFEALNSEFSVQARSFSIAGGGTSGTVAISSVDLTKSFVIGSYLTEYDDDNMRSAGTIVFLNSPTQVRAERDFASSKAINDIRVFVVTLTGSVNVIRGSLAYSGLQATSTIAGVSTTSSVVSNGVASPGPGVMRSAGFSAADVDTGYQRIKLINSTTVQGDRGQSTVAATGRYEVINLAGATAVTLASFRAEGLDSSILVEWATASELSNLGFHLYRSAAPEGPYSRITDRLIPGLGSSPSGARYSHQDEGLVNGITYYYKLEDVENTGQRKVHGPVSATPTPNASTRARGTRIAVGRPEQTRLEVLSRGPTEVVLELRTGGFYAVPLEDGSVRLEVPGFSPTSAEGFPVLPVKRSWLPVASGRKVKLLAVESQEEEWFDNLRPENAGEAALVAGQRTVKLARQRRGRVRGVTATYPRASAQVLETAFQGEAQKVLLELAPVKWDSRRRRIVLSHRLVVRLSLEAGPASARTRDADGRRYRQTAAQRSRTVAARLVTREPGLYSVGFEELFRGRGQTSLPVDSLRLSRQGRTVPFHVDGGPNFAKGAKLYFLSEGAAANPYGDEAVYELETGGGGERMRTRGAAPDGERTGFYWELVEKEEDHYYQSALRDPPDRWLWWLLYAPASASFPFEVSAPAATAAYPRLRVRLQGTSDFPADPDHHVRVFVNGAFAGERTWDGKRAEVIEVELPEGILHEGENTLEIENVGDTEAAESMVMVDGYEVRYPRIPRADSGKLEGLWSTSGTAEIIGLAEALVVERTESDFFWLEGVESRRSVVRFDAEAGASYTVVSPEAVLKFAEIRRPVSSRLKDVSQSADYVILGPKEFLSAAAPLADLRREQGLRVMTASVEEVFSEFGFGENDPNAIREFLSFAYHQWKQGPRYVVLLGDATYDFKDRLGTGVKNRVPPFLIRTSYLETASDLAYAAVNGEDLLPDLAIGRLPAATMEEAHAMVAKIVAYESLERSDRRRPNRAVIVTDNPDAAGDFVADAEAMAEKFLSGRPVEKIHLSELGASAAREKIRGAFDEGAWLMSYIGHGGIALWADENLLSTADVELLSPQPEQPLLLTMNCLNGYFHFPYFNSLAEELLKADGKGAIAAFSPSGLSLNEAARVFHEAMVEELLTGGHHRLGDVVLAAQSSYAASGALPELIAIYHLFGDPAMVLR